MTASRAHKALGIFIVLGTVAVLACLLPVTARVPSAGSLALPWVNGGSHENDDAIKMMVVMVDEDPSYGIEQHGSGRGLLDAERDPRGPNRGPDERRPRGEPYVPGEGGQPVPPGGGGGETPTGETPSGETPTGESPTGETPTGETPTGETPTGETPTGETPTGETPTGETPTGETPTGETPTGETPTGETPTGETPTGETPTGETPTGETPTGETPTGETPTGETPTGETPTGETPTGETPSGETPTGETPTGETPSGETPTGETPTGETPTGETPTGETPTGETPTDTVAPDVTVREITAPSADGTTQTTFVLYNRNVGPEDVDSVTLSDVPADQIPADLASRLGTAVTPEECAAFCAGVASCNAASSYDIAASVETGGNTCVLRVLGAECVVPNELADDANYTPGAAMLVEWPSTCTAAYPTTAEDIAMGAAGESEGPGLGPGPAVGPVAGGVEPPSDTTQPEAGDGSDAAGQRTPAAALAVAAAAVFALVA